MVRTTIAPIAKGLAVYIGIYAVYAIVIMSGAEGRFLSPQWWQLMPYLVLIFGLLLAGYMTGSSAVSNRLLLSGMTGIFIGICAAIFTVVLVVFRDGVPINYAVLFGIFLTPTGLTSLGGFYATKRYGMSRG